MDALQRFGPTNITPSDHWTQYDTKYNFSKTSWVTQVDTSCRQKLAGFEGLFWRSGNPITHGYQDPCWHRRFSTWFHRSLAFIRFCGIRLSLIKVIQKLMNQQHLSFFIIFLARRTIGIVMISKCYVNILLLFLLLFSKDYIERLVLLYRYTNYCILGHCTFYDVPCSSLAIQAP